MVTLSQEEHAMKTKEEARAIVNGLKALYPDGICSLQYQKDY